MNPKIRRYLMGFVFGFVQFVWGIMIMLLMGLVTIRFMVPPHFAGFMIGVFGAWVSVKLTKLFGYDVEAWYFFYWTFGEYLGIGLFLLPMILFLLIL